MWEGCLGFGFVGGVGGGLLVFEARREFGFRV